MNPCPCGLADNEGGSCRCSPDMIRRYRQGALGPLMDRIDLTVKPSRPSPDPLLSAAPTQKSSAQLRGRVTFTLERQLSRQGCLNRDLAGDDISEVCGLSNAARAELIEALTALNGSARNASAPSCCPNTRRHGGGEAGVDVTDQHRAVFS